jgi:uncharacterized protein (DUF885 family)
VPPHRPFGSVRLVTEQRQQTEVDRLAEAWVDTTVELHPEQAVWLGRKGYEGRYGDLSPAGLEAHADAVRRTLAAVRAAAPVDEVDEVTKLDLVRDLALQLERHEARVELRDVNVIASPAQEIREIFDLEPDESPEDWANIASRLANVPAAIDGYLRTLRAGIEQRVTPARRQVELVAEEAVSLAAEDGFFRELAGKGEAAGVPDAVAADLARGAAAAAAAYSRLSRFLREELAPHALEQDAVGRQHYALAFRYFVGATVDLDETYEWGLEELDRMVREQEAIAREIKPGASVEEAIAVLDQDPARRLEGTEALREWMQGLSDRAIDALGASHFDIPGPIRRLECRIAPTHSGAIYYSPPSDDFSRPGRMWWSVPKGVTSFSTWRETTSVYHEGVPGHHLQVATAAYNKDRLNTWRRITGTSGHDEGWALYAERLMAELGYLDDPADRLGMLDGQRMRAARVVLDIGVHLGKRRPDGQGVWDADYALRFMRRHVHMNDPFIRFEVNRYLGWPGQAPSYKVGQRIWEQTRDAVRGREGADWDVKAFHKRALDLGGVGLDTLRSTLLG